MHHLSVRGEKWMEDNKSEKELKVSDRRQIKFMNKKERHTGARSV